MFKQGQNYTRRQIHASLGGSIQSYLPTASGRVVCACLRRDINPEAPFVILVGNGAKIKQAGALLAAQPGTIPVFIKQSTGAWTYSGLFRVRRSSQLPADTKHRAVAAFRADVTRVIFLELSSD